MVYGSLIEVIKDLMVASYCLVLGEMYWFWLVMASFIATSIYYALVLERSFYEERSPNWLKPIFKHRRFAWILVVLPVAQLLPAATLRSELELSKKWLESRRESEKSRGRRMGWKLGVMGLRGQQGAPKRRQKQHPLSSTFADQQLAPIQEVLDAFESTNRRQYSLAHRMLYTGVFLQSMPQAWLQSSAFLHLLKPNDEGFSPLPWLLMFSILTSLLSASRVYYLVAKTTSDLDVFAFKLLCAVYDLFSFYYVGISVAASAFSAEPQSGYSAMEVLLIDYPLDPHLVLWRQSLLFAAGCGTCALVASGISSRLPLLRIKLRGMHTWVRVAACVMGLGLVCFLAVFAFIALVVGLQAVKLSLIAALLSVMEPMMMDAPQVALSARHFVAEGAQQCRKEWKRRVQFLSGSTCHHAIDRCRQLQTSSYLTQTIKENEAMLQLVEGPVEEFQPYRLFWRKHYTLRTQHPKVTALLILVGIVGIPSIVFSIAIPFLDAFSSDAPSSSQTGEGEADQPPVAMLKSMCIGVLLLCCACLLPLLRSAISFVRHTAALSPLMDSFTVKPSDVREWIEDYHTPSAMQILNYAAPDHLLPVDVTLHMGEYLAVEHVALTDLTLDASQRIRETASRPEP